MAADGISGYIHGLLHGIEFQQTAYAHDRNTRRSALYRFLREASGKDDGKNEAATHRAFKLADAVAA